ncbi:MAG: PaaI family thioesterase [Burkholderiales bacterium]
MDAAAVQKMVDPMFPGTMGVKILEVSPDRVTAELEVRQGLCTRHDTLHGGAYMAFADTLGAVGTIVSLPKGARTSTLESKTNFLGSAPLGTKVLGESTPLHRGRTTQVWTTRITNEQGKLLAVVTQTQIIIPAT